MSKAARISPRWLDSMLRQWGLRSARDESRSLGYPSTCPMLKSGIPTTARSYEPEGVAPWEMAQLKEEIARLERRHLLAITRTYKPWHMDAITTEMGAFDVTLRTWQRWLHEAAAILATKMRSTQDQRTAHYQAVVTAP